MLDYIGTENFKYKLKQAIDAEATAERKAKWVELLSAFATQVESRTGYRTVKVTMSAARLRWNAPMTLIPLNTSSALKSGAISR